MSSLLQMLSIEQLATNAIDHYHVKEQLFGTNFLNFCRGHTTFFQKMAKIKRVHRHFCEKCKN